MRRFPPFRLSAAFGPVLAAIVLLAGHAWAAAEHEGNPASQAPSSGIVSLLPADSVTEHVLDLAGEKLAYTATAGTMAMKDVNAAHIASIYYTAYRLKGAEVEGRPITFVLNGGPGAASVYLHLGAVGPYVADFGPQFDGAQAKLQPNPDTWLRFTDLVLVDPVGTGWSRVINAEKAGEFYGIQSDAEWLAKVVALYLSRNDRLGSPVYLLGESYGGFRAVKLARALQRSQGIVVSGLVMASPFLEGALQLRSDRLALGAALLLPSIAAAELDRAGRFTPERLAEAERFAMTEYLVTLSGPPPEGDTARRFYDRVSDMTGLPADVVARARGFVGEAYLERAAGDRGEVVSPYDATFAVPDPYPESVSETGHDAMLDGFLRALGGLFVGYARQRLGYETEITFRVLNSEVSQKWDWGGGRAQASAVGDLRELMAVNPGFRLLVTHGRSDLVTPYGISRYVIDHLPGEALRKRARLVTYRYGHMFYLNSVTRAEFAADARRFYAAAEP